MNNILLQRHHVYNTDFKPKKRRNGAFQVNSKIKITILGKFKVVIDDIVMVECISKPGKGWEAFVLLALARDKPIPNEQIIELLWSDDLSSNPQNALKNLIYCLRRDINNACNCEQNIILFSQGNYCINPYTDVSIDVMTIEDLYKSTFDDFVSDDVKIQTYKKMLELYSTGPVLSIVNHPFVQVWTIRLKNIVMSACNDLCRLYFDSEKYQDIIDLCRYGIIIDSCNQDLYMNMMAALNMLEQYDTTINEYFMINKKISEDSMADLHEGIRSLYSVACATLNPEEQDIVLICAELRACIDNSAVSKKAYFCTYEVFKHMCGIKNRDAIRLNKKTGLVLVSITDKDDVKLDEDMLETSMNSLKMIIGSSLRKGDVFAKYSPSQYIIMMVTDTVEPLGKSIINRVEDKFINCIKSKNVKLTSLAAEL